MALYYSFFSYLDLSLNKENEQTQMKMCSDYEAEFVKQRVRLYIMCKKVVHKDLRRLMQRVRMTAHKQLGDLMNLIPNDMYRLSSSSYEVHETSCCCS